MVVFDSKQDQLLKTLPSTVYVKSILELNEYPISIPVAFRGMTKKDLIEDCYNTKRLFYYIDTGYLGNMTREKNWFRIVKNNVQHSTPIEVPADRYEKFKLISGKHFLKSKWNTSGSNILIVTPSEKPCNFYNISKEDWLNNTLTTLKQHTDRKIIIREKVDRNLRSGPNSIYRQIVNDDIYAVVTYNSIAATEAIAYGIPAFANAPINAAMTLCLDNFRKIETPFYPDRDQVEKWLHWLAYCQYSRNELSNGTAFRLQEEFNLC